MRSIAVPEAYAIDALRLVMCKGASLPAVTGDFAFLAVFTDLMVVLATAAFERAL